jgi:hypothetical protein
MNNKIPLSVIILAHSSDQKLRAAIHSVHWAAEVLLIWTGEDKAPIFSDRSVHLISMPGRIFDFARVRNDAIKHASNEWIFFLDSDEVVGAETPQQIAQHLDEQNIAGVMIRRRDFFLGKEMKWGEVKNVKIVRLARKEKIQFSRDVHEIAQVDGRVVESMITIDHYSHDSVSKFLQKIISYAQIEKDLRLKRQEKISFWQMILWPVGKFLWNFFFLLGFLDGWRGLIYATIMSLHSFTVRALVYEANSQQHKS